MSMFIRLNFRISIIYWITGTPPRHVLCQTKHSANQVRIYAETAREWIDLYPYNTVQWSWSIHQLGGHKCRRNRSKSTWTNKCGWRCLIIQSRRRSCPQLTFFSELPRAINLGDWPPLSRMKKWRCSELDLRRDDPRSSATVTTLN